MAALAAGGLSALLTKDGMAQFAMLEQPPLSPPGWIFPVVWSVLYLLMGISAAMVRLKGGREKLWIFWGQLAVNFLWSIFFFGRQWYFFSFAWLVLLFVLVAGMILSFRKVSPKAAALQLPYLLWLAFAGYLNLGVALLNP
nr:TspO/MBR family protein [Anaerotignum lactatifermentans]